MQNINQSLYSQKTPHISPLQASYGVSIVRIFFYKIDCIKWYRTVPSQVNASGNHIVPPMLDPSVVLEWGVIKRVKW